MGSAATFVDAADALELDVLADPAEAEAGAVVAVVCVPSGLVVMVEIEPSGLICVTTMACVEDDPDDPPAAADEPLSSTAAA